MSDGNIKFSTIEDSKKPKTRVPKSFYNLFTQLALMICIFVSVAVSQANRVTGVPSHKVYLDPIKDIEVDALSNSLNGLPAKYNIHGIDVARYQKEINWNKVKKAGVKFAFIKATEGIGLKDSFLDANWAEAKKAGIRRSAYHFYIAEKDPAIQAANFLYNTNFEPGDLPPVLDVEVTRGMSGKVIRDGVQVWLDMVEKAYGVKPIIYTGYHFYKNYLEGHFPDYPLWIAHYKGYENAKLNREWIFWQHSDRGTLAGISEEVDLNVFRGDIAALDAMRIPEKEVKPRVDFVSR